MRLFCALMFLKYHLCIWVIRGVRG